MLLQTKYLKLQCIYMLSWQNAKKYKKMATMYLDHKYLNILANSTYIPIDLKKRESVMLEELTLSISSLALEKIVVSFHDVCSVSWLSFSGILNWSLWSSSSLNFGGRRQLNADIRSECPTKSSRKCCNTSVVSILKCRHSA